MEVQLLRAYGGLPGRLAGELSGRVAPSFQAGWVDPGTAIPGSVAGGGTLSFGQVF